MTSAWDEGNVYYSEAIGENEGIHSGELQVTPDHIKELFRRFIREFRRDDTGFLYRDMLRRHYMLKKYYFEVDMEHLAAYNAELTDNLTSKPSVYLPLFEDAARDVVDDLTKPRPAGEEIVEEIQVLLNDERALTHIRQLESTSIGRLVRIPGIIISASPTQAKARKIAIECDSCGDRHTLTLKPGFQGITLPRHCKRDQEDEGNNRADQRCKPDPYVIRSDASECIDQQRLKLQEAPDTVPTGEMPRHLLLAADRSLTNKVVPGTRVTVMGIYSIPGTGMAGGGSTANKSGRESVTLRNPYLRVCGITVETSGPGRVASTFTEEEEQDFIREAHNPNLLQSIIKSIAPSIYGSDDIKKAVACLLFGGSRKQLPDGMRLRGDINVLLLGDPGTAKSQFLKFVEKVAPIGVYTSGKGSSAAGLTASVVRDAGSREFYMEGGAMVLADGGVVCIDEFDKMRESDRVAIHEAMEQQTISIAKAGITAILNSRTSVCAAANSVHGRWDESKDIDENIEFQSTILSRFDLIFLIKDKHDSERDAILAKHVMNVHMRATEAEVTEGEMSIEFLKRYINYCRLKCGPRLSESAAKKLASHFVKFRAAVHQGEVEKEKKSGIPITVRQLEAIVRISESLAKMTLSPYATEQHVDEAVRLFQVSTLDAALSGDIQGMEGMTRREDMDQIRVVEEQMLKRFQVGSRVSTKTIVEDFVRQGYMEYAVHKVLGILVGRGLIQRWSQGKSLYRIR